MSILSRASRAALLLAIVGAALFPAVASAGSAFRFDVTIGMSCLSGKGPRDARHVVTLRSSEGGLRGRFTTHSSARGRWIGCFAEGSFPPVVVNAGDRVIASAEGQRGSFRVHDIRPSTDRVADTVSGSAPAGSAVAVGVQPRGGKPGLITIAQADASGRWEVEFDELDLLGGDLLTVVLTVGRNRLTAPAAVPFVQLGKNNDVVFGAGNARDAVALELRDDAGNLKGAAVTGEIVLGLFVASLRDAEGQHAYPATGDTLTASIASDASLRVPRTLLRGVAATDVVEGRCMPNAPFQLVAGRAFVTGVTRSDGTFRRDVSSSGNVRLGDALALTCTYATGDVLSITNTVRH